MRRIACGFILALFVFGHGAGSAKADTDQRCLALCIDGGGSGAACLPQCTYNLPPPPAPASPDDPAVMTRKLFDAPKPLSEIVLPPSQAAKPVAADKDYRCLNQCVQNGGQYQLCSQSCTKEDCSPGAYACKDLLGAVPNSVLSSSLTRTNPNTGTPAAPPTYGK